ncbi:MAG TPA: amidohydrolase, partial [Alteromonas sp.]|nr:amidohydrolase [Alteromonas sp.]
GDNGQEFGLMVEAGMPPAKAIQAATINAATMLGIEDKLGTLEAGKFADIVAVKGNPLEDITTLENVQFVMKGGKIYKQ